MKHSNVAIFVPHEGCAHQCVFCNQHTISGELTKPAAQTVTQTLQNAIDQMGQRVKNAEIAFFGGSFTAIDPEYMHQLLAAALPFVGGDQFAGIRISTRPDTIDEQTLAVLKQYGVTAIELGAQSMDDHVLALNKRGHCARDVVESSQMIRAAGFSLGLQMMTGMVGDTGQGTMKTAKILAELCPDTMRIYPSVVFRNTELAQMYHEGRYEPQTLSQAVSLCVELLEFFIGKDIPVIRLGLHAGNGVEDARIAGPWHPAFRELCENEIYRKTALQSIAALGETSGNIQLIVHKRALSKMIGQGARNIITLEKMGFHCKVTGEDWVGLWQVVARNI